jgi:hypothetical protein
MFLITCTLVTGIVYGDDPIKGSGTDSVSSGSGTNMGWQEYAGRQYVLYNDGLRLSTGVSASMTGVSWNINISSNFDRMECCQPISLKQSWCNFNADDPRCLD